MRLEALTAVVLTPGTRVSQRRRTAVANHSNHKGSDSLVDAAAIFMLIVLVVGTAVFWVSHQ